MKQRLGKDRPENLRRTLLSLAIIGAGSAPLLYAQEAPSRGLGIEEITVTATRRSENMQDVPVAMQALSSQALEQLDVSTIDDFLKYLPSVSAANMGPAQGNIYMRGLSVGTLGTQGQGSIGAWPNVAVYLDEQSTQIPGRNLDVYAADLERIEVLEGPQGTLFGAGAQAGVLRYITNKPKLDVTEGSFSGSYGMTEHGGENGSAEAVLNIPLIEGKLAVRVVAYTESRGGYIDNVGSTFTRRSTDLGLAYRTGGRVPEDSVVINNYHIEENDINDVNYKGMRLGIAYRINDDWDVLVAQSYQNTDASGVFYQHPNGSENQPLKPLQVTLFNPNNTDDKFRNTAWTVNGRVGAMDLVYSGAYLKRDSEQIQDYTNYARGVWASYYQCTGYSGNSVDKCYTPSATWHDTTENKNQSQELRLSTPSDWRLRGIAGLFWEKRELNDDTEWLYKSVPECYEGGPASCFLYLQPSEAPKFQSATMTNMGRRNPNTGFFDDFQRTYEQKAAFVSVDFDIIPDVLTITGGTRYYEITNEMLGGNMGSFYCKVYGTGETGPCTGALYGYGDATAPYGNNLDEQPVHDDKATGFKSRANISWNITEDVMVYATWSEGFRMGGFNRAGACYLNDENGVKQWCVPQQYDSDELTNIELGWKTMLFDNRLQFNGAIYKETWKDVQTGLFAPQLGIGNLTIGLNGPEYEVKGIEFQIVAQPTDGLTIQGSASYNDTELTNSPGLISNNPGSSTYGNLVEIPIDGVYTAITGLFGDQGDSLANSPEVQANARARYEWDMSGYDAFVQIGAAYQSSSLSSATQVNQYKTSSWTSVDMSMGVAKDQWTLEFYGTNITDENSAVYTSNPQFIVAEVPMRPRTLSVRLGYRFGG